MTAAVLVLSVAMFAAAGSLVAGNLWAAFRFGGGVDRDDPPKGLDFDKLTPDERRRVLDG
jgi:hypothetical protein